MKFDLTYQRATECTGGEKPGARALQDFLLAEIDTFPGASSIDSGIYNCRNIGDTGTKSVHSEGRAGDTGVRLPGGDWPSGRIPEPRILELIDDMIISASKLGLQYLIYSRRSWNPTRGWRSYGGASPHHDHIHWELTREAAEQLTPEYVLSVLKPEDATMLNIYESLVRAYHAGGRQPSPTEINDWIWHYVDGTDTLDDIVLYIMWFVGTQEG